MASKRPLRKEKETKKKTMGHACKRTLVPRPDFHGWTHVSPYGIQRPICSAVRKPVVFSLGNWGWKSILQAENMSAGGFQVELLLPGQNESGPRARPAPGYALRADPVAGNPCGEANWSALRAFVSYCGWTKSISHHLRSPGMMVPL